MQQKYQCHICMQKAHKPVVTPCGHLFCWNCIYHWLRSNQQYLTCPICKSGLEIPMLRPIYYPGEPVQKSEKGIPPRPRAIKKNRVAHNYSGELPKSISKIGMNLYKGVLLAGYGLLPSCYSMFRQRHIRPLPNQDPFGSNIEYKLANVLEVVFFVLVIVLMVFWIFI